MANKKKNKKKNRSTDFLKNANLATSGSGNNPTITGGKKTTTQETAISRKSLASARKMAKIEAYAKKHNVTVTQAMIHFM